MRKLVRIILGKFCPEISAEGTEGVVILPKIDSQATDPVREQSHGLDISQLSKDNHGYQKAP